MHDGIHEFACRVRIWTEIIAEHGTGLSQKNPGPTFLAGTKMLLLIRPFNVMLCGSFFEVSTNNGNHMTASFEKKSCARHKQALDT